MKNTVLFLLIFPTIAGAQSRFYVKSDATGSATGQSWTDAFTNPQNAIQAAQASDEIWIAAGIYKPTAGNDRTVSFEPQSGVQVYGGFAGSETTLEERNWTVNPTILSGDIGILEDSTDNSLNVMYLFEPDSITVLDGLTFRYGNAITGSTPGFSKDRQFCGGGLYIMALNGDAYPTIRNCTFEQNTAQNFGGGLMVNGGGMGSSIAPKVLNCTFSRNRSLNYGGGMARTGGSVIERGFDIVYSRFNNNSAQIGGGLYYSDSNGKDTIEITGCNFDKNTSSNWGGGASISPSRFGKTYFRMDYCIYTENTAKTAAALDVFPATGVLDGKLEIKNCIFKKNITNQTGLNTLRFSTIGTNSSSILIYGNVFTENTGKIIIDFSSAYSNFSFNKNDIDLNDTEGSLLLSTGDFDTVTINNVTLHSNLNTTSTLLNPSSSGITILSNSKIINDCCSFGTYINSTGIEKLFIQNCLFKGQPDIFIIQSTAFSGLTCYVINSIICDTISENYYDDDNIYVFSNNYLTNSSCADLPSNLITCVGPMFTNFDPLFINPDSNNYHLQPCSPLINEGTNAVIQPDDTDLDNNPRIRGGTVDIGPYESDTLSLTSAPQPIPSCPGLNNGSVAISTASACEPVQYFWSGPNGASGTDLAQLASGDYTLTVTDAKNDTLLVAFSIPVGPTPQVNAQTTAVFCGTTFGGTANLTGSNSTAPYLFDWGNGVTDSMRTGLVYGSYPVTITDALGCTSVATIQIARMGNLQIQIDKTPIACYGDSNGAITIQPTNGASPYQWFWENTGSTEPGISGLAPGSYTGTLTDALGCAINWIVPLENPDSITIPNDIIPATGPANADGSIILYPSGGTGNFTAIWDNGQNGLEINDLSPGFYTAIVTDEHGCTQIVTVEVTWSVSTLEAQVLPVKVWPNPVHDWVSILPHSEINPYSFMLLDAQGRVLRSITREDAGGFSVSMGDLAAGVYAWRVVSMKGSAGGVLVKD